MSSDNYFTLLVEGIQVVWCMVWCWCGHLVLPRKTHCVTKLLPNFYRAFSKPDKSENSLKSPLKSNEAIFRAMGWVIFFSLGINGVGIADKAF